MADKNKPHWFNAAQKKGKNILMAASRSEDPELKRKAERILDLFRNAAKVNKLEMDLGISPEKRVRGALIVVGPDILATIGRVGKIPDKGYGTLVYPDLWGRIERLGKLAEKKISELEPKAARLKTPRKKPTRKAPGRRRK